MKFKQSNNLTLNDGEEVGDGEEGARGGRPLAKALGDRAYHLLQLVDVRLFLLYPQGRFAVFRCHSMGPPSSLSLIIGPIKRKIDLLSKEISMFSRTNWSWYQPVSHSTDCSRRRDIPRVDVPCSCFGTRTCRTASRQ